MADKCDGCGTLGSGPITMVRVTNGALFLCKQCLSDINRKNPQLNPDHLKRIIGDWVRFHGFTDDCDYPLISPADVVLEDLIFRLTQPLVECDGDPRHEIDKSSRKRWETIPDCKGKERRLRRRD